MTLISNFTNKATTSEKYQLVQCQLKVDDESGKRVILANMREDDNTSTFRGGMPRSMREAWRRMFDAKLGKVHLTTMGGIVLWELQDSTTTDPDDFIDEALTALEYTTTSDRELEARSPQIDSKDMRDLFNTATVYYDSGFYYESAEGYVLDDVGCDNLARPKKRSNRLNDLRRLLAVNSDSTTLRLQTMTGVILRDIKSHREHDSGVNIDTVAELVGRISEVINHSTSLPSSVPAISSVIPTTSFLKIFHKLIVTTPDGVLAIDDTGETGLTRINERLSLRTLVQDVMKEVGSNTHFFLPFTSSLKIKRMIDLSGNAAANTLAQVLNALTEAL